MSAACSGGTVSSDVCSPVRVVYENVTLVGVSVTISKSVTTRELPVGGIGQDVAREEPSARCGTSCALRTGAAWLAAVAPPAKSRLPVSAVPAARKERRFKERSARDRVAGMGGMSCASCGADEGLTRKKPIQKL